MVNFEYLVPTKVVFGRDTELETGRLVKEFGGHKVLVHWGGGHVRDTGLLARVEESLARRASSSWNSAASCPTRASRSPSGASSSAGARASTSSSPSEAGP